MDTQPNTVDTDMQYEGIPFLDTIQSMLGESRHPTLYPCIRDLVEHGLDRTRFAAGERTPQRQDITQYLAAWSRHAGLSDEESSAWLIGYCVAVLAPLSKRTPAAIRHSTKGNLRYIYRCSVPFLCRCEKNPFHAHCSPECPVYAEMQAHILANPDGQPRPRYRPPMPVFEPVLPVKMVYREQFETGMRLALEEVRKGTKLARIVEILKERGLKTRTGRVWVEAGLSRELRAWRRSGDAAARNDPAPGSPEHQTAQPNAAPNEPTTEPANPPPE
jgi:hypothetical protein